MGAVLISLPAALIGAVYYTMTLGLGALAALSLYTALGLLFMSCITALHVAIISLSKAYNNPATRAR